MAQQAPETPVDPTQITRDYITNSMRADATYRDKYITIAGRVDTVEPSHDVRYKSQVGRVGFESATPHASNIWYCGFDSGRQKDMSVLAKGELLTLNGQYISSNHLEHCRLLSHNFPPQLPTAPDPKLGFFVPQNDPTLVPVVGVDYLAKCSQRSPIQLETMLPRVYTEHRADPNGPGWRPVKMMTFDIRIKNISTRTISAIRFTLKDKYIHSSAWKYDWLIDKDDPRIGGPAIKPQEGQILSFVPAIDLSSRSSDIVLELENIRYDNGEIVDFYGCPLGRASISTPDANEPSSIAENSSIELVKAQSCDDAKPVGGDVFPPRVISAVSAIFPKDASHGGIVLVGLCVDPQGIPHNIHIVKSAGTSLDAAAITAAQQYRFLPGLKDGKPVTVLANVALQFQTGNEWLTTLPKSH